MTTRAIERLGGNNCAIDFNECISAPCQNGALCVESGMIGWAAATNTQPVAPNSYECHCQPGFVGSQCDVDIDECQSEPCFNNGSCTDSSDNNLIATTTYYCECSAGFQGSECEVDVNECASEPCNERAALTRATIHLPMRQCRADRSRAYRCIKSVLRKWCSDLSFQSTQCVLESANASLW